MRDIEHPWFSRCGPEGLLRQVCAAAARYGVKVAGENALCRFDADAYEKIITNCRGEGNDPELWRTGQLLPPMASFTFLRLGKELFEDNNFKSFVGFVQRMVDETGSDTPPADRGANKDGDNRDDVAPVGKEGKKEEKEAEAAGVAGSAAIFSEASLKGDALC